MHHIIEQGRPHSVVLHDATYGFPSKIVARFQRHAHRNSVFYSEAQISTVFHRASVSLRLIRRIQRGKYSIEKCNMNLEVGYGQNHPMERIHQVEYGQNHLMERIHHLLHRPEIIVMVIVHKHHVRKHCLLNEGLIHMTRKKTIILVIKSMMHYLNKLPSTM